MIFKLLPRDDEIRIGLRRPQGGGLSPLWSRAGCFCQLPQKRILLAGKQDFDSTIAQSALESLSQRAQFLLNEYDSHPLKKYEAELLTIDEKLAIITAKLSGEYIKKKGRTSLAGMLMRIKTWGS